MNMIRNKTFILLPIVFIALQSCDNNEKSVSQQTTEPQIVQNAELSQFEAKKEATIKYFNEYLNAINLDKSSNSDEYVASIKKSIGMLESISSSANVDEDAINLLYDTLEFLQFQLDYFEKHKDAFEGLVIELASIAKKVVELDFSAAYDQFNNGDPVFQQKINDWDKEYRRTKDILISRYGNF